MASCVGATDADVLVRGLAAAGAHGRVDRRATRGDRLRASERGPDGRAGAGDRLVGAGVVVRDGRVALTADAAVDATLVLRAAAAAAELGVPFDRASLDALRRASTAIDVDRRRPRRGSCSCCAAGRQARAGVRGPRPGRRARARCSPSGSTCAPCPQRNAYHRFTVDRHLLEAVAECAAILDDDGFDGDGRARRPPRAAAARARCSTTSARASPATTPTSVPRPPPRSARRHRARRPTTSRSSCGSCGTTCCSPTPRPAATSPTRTTIVGSADAVGRHERLDLLYVLTIGDSRATGPAAWSPSKAALVRELFSKTDDCLERRRRGPGRRRRAPRCARAHADLLARRELSVAWSTTDDGLLRVHRRGAGPHRPARHGRGRAALFGLRRPRGRGLQRRGRHGARGVHRRGRLRAARRRRRPRRAGGRCSRGALRGARAGRGRASRSGSAATGRSRGDVAVRFDLDASLDATVVEVHATDEVGLLARLAAMFADLELDVRTAKVATLGDRVVDVFYVRTRRVGRSPIGSSSTGSRRRSSPASPPTTCCRSRPGRAQRSSGGAGRACESSRSRPPFEVHDEVEVEGARIVGHHDDDVGPILARGAARGAGRGERAGTTATVAVIMRHASGTQNVRDGPRPHRRSR